MNSFPLHTIQVNHPFCSLDIDRDFDNVESLKKACPEFAIKEDFEFKAKSSKSMYSIVCKGEKCTWRLYASAIDGISHFRIRTFKSEHNHANNKKTTTALIVSYIAEKLKDQSNYRPVDIVLDIKRELDVEITYSKALRARDAALEFNNETQEDAYKNLPRYCEDLETADLKTKAFVECTVENKFRRHFSVTVHVQLDLSIVVHFSVSTVPI